MTTVSLSSEADKFAWIDDSLLRIGIDPGSRAGWPVYDWLENRGGNVMLAEKGIVLLNYTEEDAVDVLLATLRGPV